MLFEGFCVGGVRDGSIEASMVVLWMNEFFNVQLSRYCETRHRKYRMREKMDRDRRNDLTAEHRNYTSHISFRKNLSLEFTVKNTKLVRPEISNHVLCP